MVWRLISAGLLATALAGCGQPTAPTPADAPPEISSTPTPQPAVQADIAAQLAALPAPYNQADYNNGRRIFMQCKSCHVVEAGAGNRVGPNLHGVFGRKAGSIDFAYSPALKKAGFTWDEARLDAWLANPQKDLPGTRMSFAGLPKPDQRRDVIAYLKIESTK